MIKIKGERKTFFFDKWERKTYDEHNKELFNLKKINDYLI